MLSSDDDRSAPIGDATDLARWILRRPELTVERLAKVLDAALTIAQLEQEGVNAVPALERWAAGQEV